MCDVFEKHAFNTVLADLILLTQQKMSKEEIYVETDNGLEVVGAGIGDSGCSTLQHHLRFQPAMSFNDWITNGMTHEPLPERTNT